jgi:hypothetical protein
LREDDRSGLYLLVEIGGSLGDGLSVLDVLVIRPDENGRLLDRGRLG